MAEVTKNHFENTVHQMIGATVHCVDSSIGVIEYRRDGKVIGKVVPVLNEHGHYQYPLCNRYYLEKI